MTELMVIENVNASLVFTPQGVDDIYKKIEDEVKTVHRDISTLKGRKEIASFARKIASSKVALDELGKNLVEAERNKVKLVEAERKRIREKLEALQEDFRKPLTDWENAEKERVKVREYRLADIAVYKTLSGPNLNIANLHLAIKEVQDLSTFDWLEFKDRADREVKETIAFLQANLASAIKAEHDRIELERLRREQDERAQKEREQKLKAEAAERAKLEAEEKAAKDAKIAAAKAEEIRLAAQREKEVAEIKLKAAEQAKKDAEAKALKEKHEAAERLKQAEEKSRAEKIKADQEKQAAIQKATLEEQERQRKAKEAEELAQKKREENLHHRKKINNEVLTELLKIVIDEQLAKSIIEAIAKGTIPNITINY